MLKGITVVSILVLSVFTVFPKLTNAQQKPAKKERKGEFYFSWGYNKEWYTRSSLKISQPELGNKFSFVNFQGHDHPGWDEGLFSKALSIPQYNYRLGYFFNKKKGWGFEINFDHTKFLFPDDKMVHVKGIVNNKPYDGQVFFSYASTDSSSYYYLNNGANFLLFNLVKRWQWIESKNGKVRVDALLKAGIGPLIPHVENKFFDQPHNDKHFQVGGWNIGVEGAVRATFFQTVFLEYTNKLDYARYSGLRIYKGTARQAFGTYEMILNLGVTFPMGRKID
jgi:hypothetical protein